MKNLFLVILFLSLTSNAQTEAKIKESVQNYFKLEREQIFVQLNKSQFITNEQIGFKGYVIQKSNRLPNLITHNVYVILYNESGVAVQKKTMYCNLSVFDGTILLDEKIPSGRYYLQFYTNHMNNFAEDESFVQRIEITNRADVFKPNSKDYNLENCNIQIHPESGVLIADVVNTVGIQIQDAVGKPIQVSDGKIKDEKGNDVADFFSTKLGYGKFEITPKPNTKYTATFSIGEKVFTQILPPSVINQLAIKANFNPAINGFLVEIFTNSNSSSLFASKKYVLAVQQNQNVTTFPIVLNNQGQASIEVSSEQLFDGVNSFRLIDSNTQQVAERMVYFAKSTLQVPEIECAMNTATQASLLGMPHSNLVNLSVCLVPTNSLSNEIKSSLVGTFMLNNYFVKPIENTYSYFDPQNKSRSFELDMLMLNQEKSKYSWTSILQGPQAEKFPHQNGLRLKGTVFSEIGDPSKYKVLLLGPEGVFEETPVLANKEFYFENFYVEEFSVYKLELLKNNEPVTGTLKASVLVSDFNLAKKPYFLDVAIPSTKETKGQILFEQNPVSDGTELKDVKIENKFVKPKFSYQDELGNSRATAFKIKDGEFGTVLMFLRRNGFDTGFRDDFSVFVVNNRFAEMAFGANNVPGISINGMPMLDLDMLADLYMDDCDEIYIDKMGSAAGLSGNAGTINIYLKKGKGLSVSKVYTTELLVQKGFSKTKSFENYFPFTGDGKLFTALGTFSWMPKITIGDDKLFDVAFDNYDQKEVQVVIEGLGIQGEFISLKRTIPVLPKQ